MTALRVNVPVLALAIALLGTGLAGCLNGVAEPPRTVREITVWVEEIDHEIHPGVTTKVWAFCAEGDAVEPMDGQTCNVPGPTIRVTEGEEVRLTFRNTHNIPHTVHFHGWHRMAADMNGAGSIDEALVVPAGEELTVSWIAQPAGTFIYHCHFQTPLHMDMGMSGTFIVEELHPETRPDREFIAVLDEWSLFDEPTFIGAMPAYNYFTINGHSFPATQPFVAEPGEHVRIHLVNAGFQFHAMHVHGYTPMSWEGVAGPAYGVPTDVRTVAPGQSVVLDFTADREGIWLFHDHVVPSVTAGADGSGYGAYPRGMLTLLVVGSQNLDALADVVPVLLDAARGDPSPMDGNDHDAPSDDADAPDGPTVAMTGFAYAPTELRVSAGTTVTWVNEDPADHTITLDDGSVDSGDVKPGASWAFTFEEPGTYTYHCIPHAAKGSDGSYRGMIGTVVVTA